MKLIQHLRYLIWQSAYEIRRRVPLYADDRSRIFTRAATTILERLKQPGRSTQSQLALFRRYATRFTMPDSRQRMVESLAEVEGLSALQTAIDDWLNTHPKDVVLAGFYGAIRDDMIRLAQGGAYETALCEVQYSQTGPQFEKTKAKALGDHVQIHVPPHGQWRTEFDVFIQDCARVTLIGPLENELAQIEAHIRPLLPKAAVIEQIIPARSLIAPYSQENIDANAQSLGLARKLVAAAMTQRPSIKRVLRGGLDEDVSLFLGDRFYTLFQLIAGFAKAARHIGPAVPILLLPSRVSSYSAIRAALAADGQNLIYGYDYPGPLHIDFAPGAIPEEQVHSPVLYTAARALSRPLRKSLGQILADGRGEKRGQIIVAASHGNEKYRGPTASIKAALAEIGKVTHVETYPPQSNMSLLKAGAGYSLHMALTPKRSASWMSFRRDIHRLIESQSLGSVIYDIPVYLFADALVDIVLGRMDAIWAIPMASRVTRNMLRRRNRPIALALIPGRDPGVRAIARAFTAMNRPVLDIQVLFVSDLGRYAPPVAPVCTVIDQKARQIYLETFGLREDQIKMVGTVTLDEDVRRGKALGRAGAFQSLFGRAPGNKRLLVLAAQPLPEQDLFESVAALCDYMKEKSDCVLAVKLHPSHDQVLAERLSTAIAGHLGGQPERFVVIGKEKPFYHFLPAADVLLTYFSNVGLLAPAFDLPLLALPCSIALPKENLVDIGLATSVPDLDSLPAILDEALAGQLSSRQSPYVTDNPHMDPPSALPRITAIVKDMLAQQT